MVSLNECSGSSNAADDLKQKKFVKHISCDCKCKFNSTTCNSNQN